MKRKPRFYCLCGEAKSSHYDHLKSNRVGYKIKCLRTQIEVERFNLNSRSELRAMLDGTDK